MTTRPIRPFCPPDKDDPLKELPYFIEDLRFKVQFHSDKDFRVRHRTTAFSFANYMKKNPELLFKSKNYEETFFNFSEEIDKPLYLEIFN